MICPYFNPGLRWIPEANPAWDLSGFKNIIWAEAAMETKKLYYRWIFANAFGELFGLGLTFALGGLLISRMGEEETVRVILLTFAAAVASGVIEAAVVGLAQWWAMHPWFPALSRRLWFLATLAGALAAYVLGYLPSTLMSLGEQAADAPPMAEPPQWVVLLLAAGMGAAAGAVLSFAQWLALRRHVQGAGVWIPANMLAWALGMPVIFFGIDLAMRGQPLWQSLLVMALTLLAAGGLVGAVHGAFLVRLATSRTGQAVPAAAPGISS
jgi:hypothetical protein